MSDTHTYNHENREEERTTAHQTPAQHNPLHLPAADDPTFNPSILNDLRLSKRANSTYRTDLLLRAQQTHGNRAVQRMVAASTTDEEQEQNQPADPNHAGPEVSGLQNRGPVVQRFSIANLPLIGGMIGQQEDMGAGQMGRAQGGITSMLGAIPGLG